MQACSWWNSKKKARSDLNNSSYWFNCTRVVPLDEVSLLTLSPWLRSPKYEKIILIFTSAKPLCAEPLSVDLICEGELTLFCEDGTPCVKEPAIEKIKISGSTLIHKLHGNHFLNVDKKSVSLEELDTDGSIGFSFFIDRKTGQIKIISGWQKPYEYNGVCQVEPLPEQLNID